MQQSWNVAPAVRGVAGGATAQGEIAHPVRHYALIFGLLSGLFAAMQVAVSSSAALENRAAISGLYYGLQNQALDPSIAAAWLAPVLVAAYGSCLVAFGFSMWLCWHAGRAVAAASGNPTGGAGAGMLTSLLGSGIWIAASVAAVLALHTDGTASGIFATTPNLSAANLGGELSELLGQEVVAVVVALGFGAVAGRMGAGSIHMPPRATFVPAAAPPYGAPASMLPASYSGYPGYPSYPGYPPPPELYRVPAHAPGQPAPGAWPPAYPLGAASPAYPSYPPYAAPPQPGYAPYPPPAPYPGTPSFTAPDGPPAGRSALPPTSQPPLDGTSQTGAGDSSGTPS
jgi:hypothetical protein